MIDQTLANGGYMFATFRGEQTPMTEQIYFLTSDDGRVWKDLNGGHPMLISTLRERGVRDSYLLRTHDGKTFYLIATDLSIHLTHDWERAVKVGSQLLVVWESADLVKWSKPRLVHVAPHDAGCAWTPEAAYDAESGDYLLFWASTTARDSFKKQRIWACRTNDFRTFSPPFVYIKKPNSVIDATIVHDGGTYYRFSKDEQRKTVTMEVSPRLAGPWMEVPGFSLAGLQGYEGPQCYLLWRAADGRPPVWCLVMDYYATNEGYQPWLAHNLSSGRFELSPGFQFPFKLRHGSVLPVSTDELNRLRTAYP